MSEPSQPSLFSEKPDALTPISEQTSVEPSVNTGFYDEVAQDAPAADDGLSEVVASTFAPQGEASALEPSPDGGGPIAAPAALKPVDADTGKSLIRSSLVVSSLTLVSRILGFLRDLVVTAHMGASATIAADAYNTALAFPNLFRRIFAEGAFAAAFVPAYSKSLVKDGEEVADILAADAMAVLAAATIVITIAAQLTMPWLMYLINPGYAHDPAKFKLAVLLTQIAMPYLPCMAIYAHLSGVLQARGKFFFSALAPSLLNIGMLLAILPQHSARAAAVAASFGVIGSGAAQVALLWWGLSKTGAHVDLRLPRLTPEIKALINKAVPGAFAASATQLNIFITGFLASQVAGGRSWLAVADRLYQLPLGMVGVAMGVALLPRLSRAVQANDRIGSQAAMDEAVGFSLALTLPAAAALITMPFFLLDALFTRGEFHVYDAHITAKVLFQYGWGVPAFVLQQLFTRAFFARGDTTTPMRLALVSVALNIALGVGLFLLVGVQGIAAATAAASWLNVIMMVTLLVRRGDYRPSPEAITRLGKLLTASALTAGLLGSAALHRGDIQAVLGRKEIAVAATVVWGALIYIGLLFALGAVTLEEIKGALKKSPAKTASPDAA
jgi:putative peptidoglycan lipid II flippase